MTTAEERMKVLKMINEGKITAEEGAKILKALTPPSAKPTKGQSGKARWLRVHVTDMAAGKTKVKVNLPLKLMNVGLDIASQFAPEELSDAQMLEAIKEALNEDMLGKIVDVIDEEDQEHIEIFIE